MKNVCARCIIQSWNPLLIHIDVIHIVKWNWHSLIKKGNYAKAGAPCTYLNYIRYYSKLLRMQFSLCTFLDTEEVGNHIDIQDSNRAESQGEGKSH